MQWEHNDTLIMALILGALLSGWLESHWRSQVSRLPSETMRRPTPGRTAAHIHNNSKLLAQLNEERKRLKKLQPFLAILRYTLFAWGVYLLVIRDY